MIELYLTVAKNDEYTGPYVGYERQVDWPGIPDEREIVFVGKTTDGESAGINARVKRRSFSTDGVTIELVIDNCRDEYEDIKEDVVRDGFKPLYEKK